jgi:hypothetical protein
MLASDWLDGCWRCGSEDATVDDKGRQLCAPCRRLVTGEMVPYVPRPIMIGRVFWESQVLFKCWHCTSGAVDPKDDLGLCDNCKITLKEPA